MADLTPGTVLGGRFTVHGAVGRGGSATVYLAQDALRGARVALKVVHSHLAADPHTRRRLRREVEAAALLRGPGVLAPHDLHELDGLLVLSMPFHGGRTLAEHVAARGRLPVAEVAALAERLTGALARAHGAGVLHRDVTPANIMLEDGGHDAVLTDFGLSRTQDAHTRSTGMLGTAGYAAPEVYSGDRADPRSDLYGLGACLYLAATGQPPFPTHNPMGALKAQLASDFAPLSAARPDLPASLSSAITALLSADPSHRPDGAAELREHLAGRALPPAPVPQAAPAIARQYLPPGDYTVVVSEESQDRPRREANRAAHRGRRTTEAELARLGQTIAQGIKGFLGIDDAPDVPERQLVAAVAREAGLRDRDLYLPPELWDQRFRLIDATDPDTALRLQVSAEALGFKAEVAQLSEPAGTMAVLARNYWVVIVAGWVGFPFAIGLVEQLAGAWLSELAALVYIPVMVLVSVFLPAFVGAARRTRDDFSGVPVAFHADLRRTLVDPAAAAPPRYAVAEARLAVTESTPASTAPTATADAPPPSRATLLHRRAVDALNALEQAISENPAELPDPAVTDLRDTARDLRHAAEDLAQEALRLEAGLAGAGMDTTDVAALRARFDRLATLDRAGESIDRSELNGLRRALDAHERDEAARDALERGMAAVTARLLEICSTAHTARREVLGATAARHSADEAVARLRREVAAARKAVQ